VAGAGFKTFGVGDVLTASDVNTYLMQQAVMNFASSGARGSAIGTAVLAEGMVSYLADTDTVEVYDGSAWVGLGLPLGTATPVNGSMLSYSTATSVYDPTAGPMPVAIAMGTVASTLITNGQFASTTVTFPAGRFSTAPYVVVGMYEGSTNQNIGGCSVRADGETSSQFTLRRANDSGYDMAFGASWVAVEF